MDSPNHNSPKTLLHNLLFPLHSIPLHLHCRKKGYTLQGAIALQRAVDDIDNWVDLDYCRDHENHDDCSDGMLSVRSVKKTR